MTLERVDSHQLIRRLEQLGESGATLTFDADGTLWSGDVGEDGFHRAIADRLLRAEALAGMLEVAARFSIRVTGTQNDVARALWDAYTRGEFPECDMCAVMAWCYAGWTADEFDDFCRRIVADARLESRLQRELGPILEWSRRTGVKTLVVSASPRGLVEAGVSKWGFAAEDVIAASPAVVDNRIAARLVGPVPYGASKCELASARIGGGQWLASFGDNVFDVEMLSAARIGVAVHPKPALRERLETLPRVVVLDP